MESFRSEEEQVEALRRWWDENGRSTLVAVIIALAAGFGWQGWQSMQLGQAEAASDVYQAMLRSMPAPGDAPSESAAELARKLKSEFSSTTYAQFAALHLAAMAVHGGDLAEAEVQLRWVLGKAEKGSDTARVAQLRLARVVAANGATDQALAILADGGGEDYRASYAVARGDILLAAGREQEAREAYAGAQALVALGGQAGVNLPSLQAKLQTLSPVAPRQLSFGEEAADQFLGESAVEATDDAIELGQGD